MNMSMQSTNVEVQHQSIMIPDRIEKAPAQLGRTLIVLLAYCMPERYSGRSGLRRKTNPNQKASRKEYGF